MKVILSGHKNLSICNYIGKMLLNQGWEVWNYGRTARKYDSEFYHERKLDINNSNNLDNFIAEAGYSDLIIFSADSGAHENLELIDSEKIKLYIDTKLIAPIIFIKKILNKVKIAKPIKIVFLAGSIGIKPIDIMLYGIVNNAILALVNEINFHYKDKFKAYYLETPIISPSTLGDDYLAMHPELKDLALSPDTMCQNICGIIKDKVNAGFIKIEKE